MRKLGGAPQSAEIKEWLTSLIGHAPFGILALDVHGLVTLANGRIGSMLGCREARFLDRPFSDVLREWPALASCLPGGRDHGCGEFAADEVPLDGRFYSVRSRPIVDGALVTFGDVTDAVLGRREQERLVASLEDANRELAEFAYISAHDMKSPISSLVGLVGRLGSSPDVGPEAGEIVRMVERSVSLLQGTIVSLNDILAFKRTLIEPGASCDLQAVLDDVACGLEAEISACDAVLEREIQPGFGKVAVADVHLRSLLQNLVGNALKYRQADRRPRVGVSVTRAHGRVQISVTDNGRGIDLARCGDKIFGLFRRFHSDVEGTGVGLYVVKSIVRAYRGEVRVESEPGVGSRFHIEVPDDDCQ